MQLNIDYTFTPRTRDVNKHILAMLNAVENKSNFTKQLKSFQPFISNFLKIPLNGKKTELTPYLINGWLPGLDSLSLYSYLALNNPETYIEIGSGNSTKFARQAIIDHNLRTKIISIDPAPRATIDQLCDIVHRIPCENIDINIFKELSPNSLLFMDGSHCSFQNSDVTVFFTEIIPVLPKGMIWGLHDMFLPEDYIPQWNHRNYNEQYLLMSYLLGGHQADDILLPNWFAGKYDKELSNVVTNELFGNEYFNNSHNGTFKKAGTAFWFKRNK